MLGGRVVNGGGAAGRGGTFRAAGALAGTFEAGGADRFSSPEVQLETPKAATKKKDDGGKRQPDWRQYSLRVFVIVADFHFSLMQTNHLVSIQLNIWMHHSAGRNRRPRSEVFPLRFLSKSKGLEDDGHLPFLTNILDPRQFGRQRSSQHDQGRTSLVA